MKKRLYTPLVVATVTTAVAVLGAPFKWSVYSIFG